MTITSSFIEEFDDYGNIKSVADLNFTDKILGEGSYGIVRLAKRKKKNTFKSKYSYIRKKLTSSINSSSLSSDGEIWSNEKDNNRSGDLVAVKIYSKDVLKQMREVTKSSSSKRRMSIHDAYEKVQKEISIMKMVNHPNLLKLHEVIDLTESGNLYVVSEYLPLGQIMIFDSETKRYQQRNKRIPGLTDNGTFEEDAAASYFVDVLHGLAYLHKHHVCHRDIKPDNILLDERGFAKIGDFGVSYYFEDECDFQSLSRTNLFGNLSKREGTYSFWSPEMCCGNSKTFSAYASDLWACGICLYVFVSGKVPFYAEDPSEVFELICNSEIQYEDIFSHQLRDVISKLLQKDPESRATIPESLSHSFCKKVGENRVELLSLDSVEEGKSPNKYDSHSSKRFQACILQ